MKRIADGVYQNENGFWIRPTVNGKRIKKKLAAITKSAAIREAAAFNTDLARSEAGLGPSPIKDKSKTFAVLAQMYEQAGCPNRRLEQRAADFCMRESSNIKSLVEYFGEMEADKITLPALVPYKDWRMRRCSRGPGHRVIELDWVTLSNVLNYSVQLGVIQYNFVRSMRQRLRENNPKASSMAKRIRKSREVMPANGDAVTQIASHLFDDPRSESLGWQFLWAVATGCRTSELLRLRLDARNENEPGYMRGEFIYARRSKGGFNPFLKLDPALHGFLEAFLYWHGMRFPRNPWYFPGRTLVGQNPVDKNALGHALKRACLALGLSHVTPHGCRAYYVTSRRRAGALDSIVAAEIGDRTIEMISQNYGDLPGGELLSLCPKDGLPAWCRWRGVETKMERIA